MMIEYNMHDVRLKYCFSLGRDKFRSRIFLLPYNVSLKNFISKFLLTSFMKTIVKRLRLKYSMNILFLHSYSLTNVLYDADTVKS